MKIYESCKEAIASCIETKSFALAHLYSDDKPMGIHIHDCYEVYYSISGGKQFLIDNRFYNFTRGDIFFINQYESHYLSQIDNTTHERILLTIHPDYLKANSTAATDLDYCFANRQHRLGHKLALTDDEQKHFLYFIDKLKGTAGFGADVLGHAIFLELMTYLNRLYLARCAEEVRSGQGAPAEGTDGGARPSQFRIDEILSYINRHIREELSIGTLAEEFYISPSYLCRIFKSVTGTTINRYIIAKRITHAKVLLAEGHSVTEAALLCGFSDYSNFFKAFTKSVGISPKKYAAFSHS